MQKLPKLISLLVLWGAVGAVVIFISPSLLRDIVIPGAYLPFYVLLTVALWYTLTLFLRSALYGLLVTLTIITGMILFMLQLMHWGLLLTIVLTLVIESWYIYRRDEKIHTGHEQKD